MAEKKADIGELTEWLRRRMTEENLSAEELSEFTTWLSSRSCDQDHVEVSTTHSASSEISVGDVVELMGWLKGRMRDAVVKPHESRDLIGWLTERIGRNRKLTAEELRLIDDIISGDTDA